MTEQLKQLAVLLREKAAQLESEKKASCEDTIKAASALSLLKKKLGDNNG
jgi:hypothetical protein